MKNQDITRIRKILQYRKRNYIADLLKYSRSVLEESLSYGNYLYSTLSIFTIFSPLEQNEKLNQLSEQGKNDIYEAVLQIYPHKESSPEILGINYCVDFELKETELVETNELKCIDSDYIYEQIKKCEHKITESDYEGAVNNSRTLLECIYFYIYENIKGEKYDYKGDIIKLNKDVSKILNMDISDYKLADDCLKQILSGVISIVNGISTLRNNFSDAHGHSTRKSYKIDKRHAILSVNLSKSIAEYLFLTYEKVVKNSINQ